KWCSKQTSVSPLILRSMSQQAVALMLQREYHLLGNHLLANGKALVFAGSFLESRKRNEWLIAGLNILDQEYTEQFLSDGAHFELSPMYHSILIWDICDLILLSEASNLPVLAERKRRWLDIVSRGIAWLDYMSHPDGGISFFNDAAFGIAPTLKQLQDYADRLGCHYSKPQSMPLHSEFTWHAN